MLQVDFLKGWMRLLKASNPQVDCFKGRGVKERNVANAAGNAKPYHQCHSFIYVVSKASKPAG